MTSFGRSYVKAGPIGEDGETHVSVHAAAAISALIRCTVPGPTPNSLAIFSIPLSPVPCGYADDVDRPICPASGRITSDVGLAALEKGQYVLVAPAGRTHSLMASSIWLA